MAARELVEFSLLGHRVQVECDSRSLITMLHRRWSALESTGGKGDTRRYLIELESADGPRFIGPGGARDLDRRRPALHAYNLLLTDMLGRVREHFIFHATSVARQGRAIVISGPSTFGKTTLAVGLGLRGFSLLADDVTVIERTGGRLLPFARMLSLRPGTRRMLTPDELDAARRARVGSVGDVWSVDATTWLGPAPDAATSAMVVVLRPHEDGIGLRRFPVYTIHVVEGCAELLRRIETLEGVREAAPLPDDPCSLRVVLDAAEPLIRFLSENRGGILSAVKGASGEPSFAGEPRLEPMGTFQAATELCQEMQNRHEGSVIAEEYRGRESLLAADVARLLHDARCFALLPGRIDATLELLVRSFREGTS